jgi:uncharacterized membrane protein YkvA (DUF1232 family)
MRRLLTRPKDLGEAIQLVRKLPIYARLVWGLLRDERVPPSHKGKLLLLAGYLVFPLDIIPDFIPVIGQLDDVAVALLVLDHFIQNAPRDVVDEHLARIARNEDDLRADLAQAREALGGNFENIRDNLQRILDKYGKRFRSRAEAERGLEQWRDRQGRS